VGDRSAKPVFDGSNNPFDVLGTGYQRPFELATLRLFNMAGILPRCEWRGRLRLGCVGRGQGASPESHLHPGLPLCANATLAVLPAAHCGCLSSTGTAEHFAAAVCCGCAGGELSPADTQLLVQQGGTLVCKGQQVVYRHNDSGILKYADIDQVVAAATPATALPA
jgi:hypothetical protein